MVERDWRALDAELRGLLQPVAPPLAITFSQSAPGDVAHTMLPCQLPPPTGALAVSLPGVSSGSPRPPRTFTTVPEDHGNCSVGASHTG